MHDHVQVALGDAVERCSGRGSRLRRLREKRLGNVVTETIEEWHDIAAVIANVHAASQDDGPRGDTLEEVDDGLVGLATPVRQNHQHHVDGQSRCHQRADQRNDAIRPSLDRRHQVVVEPGKEARKDVDTRGRHGALL
ncbi:hypothetical protein D9M68_798620 [compost metagenome]